MTATINDLRDLTAARIPELALPVIDYTVSTRTGKEINAENCSDRVLIVVGGAAQQFERITRGDCRQQPIVAVGVHRKLPANGDGEPDQTLFDQCVELCEALAKQLLTPWLSARPVSVEQPVIYNQKALQEQGLFQTVLLVTFSAEFEA